MPNDTIDRAIKKASGDHEGSQLENVLYEGYGPHGVAVMVACLTDNRNRTAADVRHAFSKHGGKLGVDGSVAFLFSKQGQISVAADNDSDEVMEICLEYDAEDIDTEQDGTINISVAPENFYQLKEGLEKHDIVPNYADVNEVAATEVELQGEHAEQIERLVDHLEELDDVQDVSTNAVF